MHYVFVATDSFGAWKRRLGVAHRDSGREIFPGTYRLATFQTHLVLNRQREASFALRVLVANGVAAAGGVF
jgi:hypothetical protein